jgi:hypothetical protein
MPNAQLTARSNVGDFTACFCRKGANITESGGAVCYVIFLHSTHRTKYKSRKECRHV